MSYVPAKLLDLFLSGKTRYRRTDRANGEGARASIDAARVALEILLYPEIIWMESGKASSVVSAAGQMGTC